jgi:hypothetical protein
VEAAPVDDKDGDVTTEGVLVSWRGPAMGDGTPIDHYQAVANGDPDVGQCSTADAKEPSCVIRGLRPGQPYTFTVTAHGVNGTGATTSAPIGPVTAGAPSQPRNVTATAGDARATLRWDEPAYVATGINHYVVRVRASADAGTGRVASCGALGRAARTCVITDLKPRLPYTFTVTAHGSADSALASPASAPVAARPGPPYLPGAPEVTVQGSTATVFWAPSNDAVPIARYTVAVSPDEGTVDGRPTVCRPIPQGVNLRSCEVSNLRLGRAYAFTVIAHGAGATGTSRAMSPRTQVGAPAGGAAVLPGRPGAGLGAVSLPAIVPTPGAVLRIRPPTRPPAPGTRPSPTKSPTAKPTATPTPAPTLPGQAAEPAPRPELRGEAPLKTTGTNLSDRLFGMGGVVLATVGTLALIFGVAAWRRRNTGSTPT